MSLSDRHKKKRALGFEDLEAKTSPASLVGVEWVEQPSAMEVSSAHSGQHRASKFLQFVSTLEDIRIERASPTEADASAVDHWLATVSPVAISPDD